MEESPSGISWFITVNIITDFEGIQRGRGFFRIRSNENPLCPYCGGTQEKKEWTDRVRRKAGGEKVRYKIEVHRCTNENCGKCNRQLPDIWLPYKQYEADLIEDVVDGVITEADLIKEGHDYPCETTLKRWKEWAEKLMVNAEGYIRTTLHRVFELPYSFLATQISLLEEIQDRIPQGWLKAIVATMINTGGAAAMPEPG